MIENFAMKKILITGGTGLVGTKLSKLLAENSFEVRILTRNKNKKSDYKLFTWDYKNNFIEEGALKDIDVVIHLAGANIGEKRWTKSRKKEIIASRVKSAEFLYNKISELAKKPEVFISASAVGYYPVFSFDGDIFDEKSQAGNNFTALVCKEWEKAADKFKDIGIRVVKIRTGIVQDKKDPALKKILDLAKFGAIPVFSSGKQYYPWIHIEDLARIYLYSIHNKEHETINAVAPQLITNLEYSRSIKKVIGKGLIIKIPTFVIKLIFGEMADVVTKGTKIKSILHQGDFKFLYPDITSALRNLIG